MQCNQLFQQNLLYYNIDSQNIYQLFEKIGSLLIASEYVEPTFTTALIEREKHFPTGLQLEGITIAIPHTDVEHIREPFIAAAKTTEPLKVGDMGNTDNQFDVSYFFFLGITEPEEQVEVLQYLMNLFSDKRFVNALKAASNESELYEAIQNPVRSEVL
ncbi:PTS sugar transporter subunit IIA [Alteribacillus sp. HJP-4]|uniref:PTS sugar transporter subunit IIA n=1 Tax=Alteribacillus sp. HJP-4 TaxID=2775394 RepID=UPI0035CCF1DF